MEIYYPIVLQLRNLAGLSCFYALDPLKPKSRYCLAKGIIHFQSHSSYWQNSAPSGFRTEVPLLALAGGCSQLPEATRLPQLMAPFLHLQSQKL